MSTLERIVEGGCTLPVGDPPRTCHLCATPLEGRRTRWCSDACDEEFWRQHLWTQARETVRARALVMIDDQWGYRCEGCGNLTESPQVNHRTPVLGKHGVAGCWHHLDGLEVLCGPCHADETARQRAAGWRVDLMESGAFIVSRQETLFDVEQLTLVPA